MNNRKILDYWKFILENVAKKKDILEDLTEEELNFFKENDPSRNGKYIKWMAKAWLDSDRKIDRDEIVGSIQWFDNNVPRIENKDIYSYDYAALVELEKIKGQSRRTEEGLNDSDYKSIVNNDEIRIELVKSYKAAEKWNGVNPNGGRSWCIGRSSSTFESYTQHSTFYFVWIKNKKGNDRFAVQVSDNTIGKNNEHILCWNEYDASSSLSANPLINKYADKLKRILPNFKDMLLRNDHNIRRDGSYEFNTNLTLGNLFTKYDVKTFADLPIKIYSVAGDFDISNCNTITSLIGCPQIIKGSFKAVKCTNITSAEGAPSDVAKIYSLSECQLTNLKGLPKIIKRSLDLSFNPITSLEGDVEIINEDLDISFTHITTLKGNIKEIKGDVDATHIKTLKDQNFYDLKIDGDIKFGK